VLNTVAGLRSGTLTTGSLGNSFQFMGNPALSSCEITALKTALGVTSGDVSGANGGCVTCSGLTCSVASSTGTDGQSGVFIGDATIQTADDLAWMKNVVDLTGNLRMESNTTLAHMNGLGNLKTVGGVLSIGSNTVLAQINGLSGLTSVGGDVNIQTNAALTSVTGLSALTFVGGFFQIYNNDALTTLSGLSALTTVEGYLNVQSNNGLLNVDGLANLTNVGTTTSEYLQINGNSQLVSVLNLIQPAGKLASVAGNLTITSNAQLSICQADAVRTSLVNASGWARTYSNGGNQACLSPKICTGTNNAVCQ
jgi:hypothetical protein